MNLKASCALLYILAASCAAVHGQEIDYDDVYEHHRPADRYYEEQQQEQQDMYYEQQQQEEQQQQRRRQPSEAELRHHQASGRPQCGPCEKEQWSMIIRLVPVIHIASWAELVSWRNRR